MAEEVLYSDLDPRLLEMGKLLLVKPTIASPHSGRDQQIDFNNAAIYEVADASGIWINLRRYSRLFTIGRFITHILHFYSIANGKF